MSTILVVGSSGTVGAELSRLLAEAGHDVRRATSREAREPGQVQLDLLSGRGIAQAFDGAHQAFLLAPPGHTNQDRLLAPLIEAARERGLQKVVLMSAMGANADDDAPLRKAELQLERSGLPFNVIRPNWFMQNFNTFWLGGILQHGKILLPLGQARGSFIDARDIAAVAAALLTRDDLSNRDFDLTGSDVLDHDEVAALLSRETGKAITYQEIPPEALRAGLLQAGLPADYADFLLTILGYFKAGYAERSTDAVATITGRPPRRFEEYARDYRQVWLG